MTTPSYFVHSTATIDEGAMIGAHTRVWHYAHVMGKAEIGEECVVGQGCFIGNVRIGNGVRIQNNVSVFDGVELHDYVFVGPSAVFTNVVNPRSEVSRREEYVATIVRRGATIGANATLICGVTIGEYAFVGAGAVVRRDVPSFGLVVGTPARRIGWMCACGVRLKDAGEVTCGACGRHFYADEHECLIRSSQV